MYTQHPGKCTYMPPPVIFFVFALLLSKVIESVVTSRDKPTHFFFFFFYHTFSASLLRWAAAFWTSSIIALVTGVVPSPPRCPCLHWYILIAQRVGEFSILSHCSSVFIEFRLVTLSRFPWRVKRTAGHCCCWRCARICGGRDECDSWCSKGRGHRLAFQLMKCTHARIGSMKVVRYMHASVVRFSDAPRLR